MNTNKGWTHRATTAIKAIAVAGIAVGAARSAASAAGDEATFADVFGRNATGAEVKQKVLDEFDLLGQTLEEKRKAGTLTEEEKKAAAALPDARRRLAEADGTAFDQIAQLSSGETVKIDVPSGATPLLPNETVTGLNERRFSAADLEKARRDAENLAKAADAYANSPEGKAMAGTAASGSFAVSASGGVGGGSSAFGGAGAGGGAGEATIATASGTENGYYVSVFVGNDEKEGEGFLDAVPFEIFDWSYGGFSGDKAQTGNVVIRDVKFSSDGLSFEWVKDLSQWGIAHDDYTQALACLFVMDRDGKWVGGKFDWISSSRDTRDFANIYSGYNDWSLENVPNPCPAAFVIVSKDGGKRSNVIGGMWQR